MRRSILFLILVVIVFFKCKTIENEDFELGTISFEVNGMEEAKQYFDKGLLLLHSFEYQDAGENFRKAREIDPNFVMAYWGEAMTKNHPLWSAQFYDEGKEILESLAPTQFERIEKAKTDLEKEFLKAVEILYGEGTKFERDKAYSNHLARLHKIYPNNLEVAAFYALSLLGSVQERDTETYEKGAIVAEGILKENPYHPGALHYLIHSYDDPNHAHLAIAAADSYAKVAPDAGHALHMPSHIYVALGMWDQVISSNIASYDASLRKKEKNNLANDARNYHAFHWLQYGYLQKANDEKAREMLDELSSYTDDNSSTRSRAYLSMMRATYLAETGSWSDDYAKAMIEDEDLNITIRSMNHFVRGMAFFDQEKGDELRKIIDQMKSEREKTEKDLYLRGAAMCAGTAWESQLANQQDINNVYTMEMELQAVLESLEGNDELAEEWFTKATELEENTSFMFGPPVVVKPSHEMYAEWLLEKGEFDMASSQFEKCLQRAPGRYLSVKGKNRIANS